MAYVSLYRKYRPQRFDEVVGQRHVTTTLAQAVDGDRLHHAYLFTGPRGTGKTSTARILAKSLNCEQGPTSAPDNACTHCEQITTGSHVDVIEIDAASHGGVDDVRDLRERVAFAPATARMKVYIVDECHMLSTAGWNAFLKTVEEPPGHVMFVFATTEPHKVLPTILSRTQRFDFRRVTSSDLATHIESLAMAEGVTLEPGAVDLLVRAGDGSVRDTISVLEQAIAFAGAKVSAAAVADVLGAVSDSLLEETVTLIATGDVGGLCLLVHRLADGGGDPRQFARDAVAHLRSLFLLQVAPEANLPEASPDQLARLQQQAELLGRAELLRAIDLLGEAQAQMRRGNTRLPLEMALAKAALPDVAGDTAALAARLDRLERGIAAARTQQASLMPEQNVVTTEPAPPETASKATPAEPTSDTEGASESPALDLDLVISQWPVVLDGVKARSRRLHAFLSPAQPIRLHDGTLTVQFGAAFGFHAEQCSSEEWRPAITEVLASVYESPLQLRCAVADDAQDGADDELQEEMEDSSDVEVAAAAGDEPDDAALHDRAIERLTNDLGATVVEDRRGH